MHSSVSRGLLRPNIATRVLCASSPRSLNRVAGTANNSTPHTTTTTMALSSYYTTSYNPDRFMTAMERFFDDMEPRWARTVVPRSSGTPSTGKLATWRPTCDVRETDQAFVIQAEVPGAHKEDIKLELDGANLRISGEVKDEKVNKTDTYFHSERSYGTFMRTFAMPENADLEKIKAEHVNGVLHVTVPKKPQQEPAKRAIAVQ